MNNRGAIEQEAWKMYDQVIEREFSRSLPNYKALDDARQAYLVAISQFISSETSAYLDTLNVPRAEGPCLSGTV